MNTNIYKTLRNFFALSLLCVLCASCNDWLDVEPKSQIKEEDHFNREGGFKDQLAGVYTQMTEKSMYGLNMGIGFVEVLSHSYDINPNSNWRYADQFDYSEASSEGIIKQIWQSTYSCIANLNIFIRNIEKADPDMFTERGYRIYRGEAYGLRAFLHFELMRLFAEAPVTASASSKGVPYVTAYSTDVVPQLSVGETMQLIINDLLLAREELVTDTLNQRPYSGTTLTYDLYRNSFNYLACVVTLAKAYLWIGDTQNALKYANELIDWQDNHFNPGFSWIHYTNMQSTKRNELDCSFTSEHLFQLYINDWEDTANLYFTKQGSISVLTPSEATASDIYEVDNGYGNDYRYLRGYEQDGENRYMAKFWYNEGSTYNNRYPLIRMSEPYYIAAECQKQSNRSRAVELLNIVRENRNLSLFPLSTDLTADQIQQEIYKEYRKEFIGEHGELFFYYKRLNISDIKGSATRGSKSVYVLPIPSNDQEFGGYSN